MPFLECERSVNRPDPDPHHLGCRDGRGATCSTGEVGSKRRIRGARTLLVAVLVALVAATAGAATARTWLPVAPTNATAQPAATTSASGLGGGATEGHLVGVRPCRLVDTRIAKGKLAVGAVRAVAVRGTGPEFAAQGGKAGGCAIPASATLVEVTVTAVDAGSGFLRAWPGGSTMPNATFLNYDDAFNVSTTGTLSLCGLRDEPCTEGADLSVRAFGSPTHLVVDVQAYAAPPMSALLNADGTIVRSSRVVSVQKQATGRYAVAFDRDVAACTYSATVSTPDAGLIDGFATVTNFAGVEAAVFVQTFGADGVEADRPFSLDVTC